MALFSNLLNICRLEIKQLWLERNLYLFWCLLVFTLELAIFRLPSNLSEQLMLAGFVVVPLVVWSAMRFGITAALLAVLALSGIAIRATSSARLLLDQPDLQQAVFSLQVFVSTLVLVTLVIAALQSQRKSSEKAKRNSEVKLQAVIDGALDAIVAIDEAGRLLEFNPAAEQIFGYKRKQVIGRRAALMIPPSLRRVHAIGYKQFIASGEKRIFNRRLELMAMRADGTEFPVELTITSLQDKNSPVFIGYIRDITQRRKAEEEIRNLAFFDALTALPNRRLLFDRLEQAQAASARSHTHGAILFIDLDNFKSLNDTRGHTVGDLLLVEVAKRLKNAIRTEDTISRLGGDEFVVILVDLSEDTMQALAQARVVSEKILGAINEPYLLQNMQHQNSSSMGITLFSGYEIAAADLLRHSDTAMYQAKASGRNTLRFFDPAMQLALEKRISLESELRQALAQNQLQLHYQIQVNSAREAFGAEVLLRWQHPQHGLMMPAEFIPLAEESGLIVPISHWVLQQACLQLRLWENNQQAIGIQLAVNVSALRFRQPNFVDELRDLIEEIGVNPKSLKLELTESVVLDNITDTVEKMYALRAIGVQFAMDDFGTGYSSLSYLKHLPLTQVKIDRSFVHDIASDASDAAIAQTIIGMSNTLGFNVIAEGVETEAQFDLLRQYGCHQFQGFLFSRPVPLLDFEKILDADYAFYMAENSANSGQLSIN